MICSIMIVPITRVEANVTYSLFISITSATHTDTVRYIWHRVGDNSYISAGKNQGWYFLSDEAYLLNSQASVADPE